MSVGSPVGLPLACGARRVEHADEQAERDLGRGRAPAGISVDCQVLGFIWSSAAVARSEFGRGRAGRPPRRVPRLAVVGSGSTAFPPLGSAF